MVYISAMIQILPTASSTGLAKKLSLFALYPEMSLSLNVPIRKEGNTLGAQHHLQAPSLYMAVRQLDLGKYDSDMSIVHIDQRVVQDLR